MRAIDRRMANLELAAGMSGRKGPVIILGWFSSPITGAECDGISWRRGGAESQEAFEARVSREAPQREDGAFRIVRLTGDPGGLSEAGVL